MNGKNARFYIYITIFFSTASFLHSPAVPQRASLMQCCVIYFERNGWHISHPFICPYFPICLFPLRNFLRGNENEQKNVFFFSNLFVCNGKEGEDFVLFSGCHANQTCKQHLILKHHIRDQYISFDGIYLTHFFTCKKV